jgi:hypothetical protein
MTEEQNPPVPTDPKITWFIWGPPIILALVLSIFLIYILIPGNLLYAQKGTADNLLNSPKVVAELEKNLIVRRTQLENILKNGQCTENGLVVPEDGLAFLPPVTTPNAGEENQILSLPPSENLKVFDDGLEQSLSEYLMERVVLILTPEGFGTGFFIEKNTVLTNRHVVEEAGELVWIVFPEQKELHKAWVNKLSGQFEETQEDYAVLGTSIGSDKIVSFAKTKPPMSLTPVVSAGFPGDVLKMMGTVDFSGGALVDPFPLFFTNGTVNAEQNLGGANGLIYHSADISKGNSGGPLVNACGQLLGVNTFIKTANPDQEEYRNLSLALNASGVLEFLSKSNIKPKISEEFCSPASMPKSAESNGE